MEFGSGDKSLPQFVFILFSRQRSRERYYLSVALMFILTLIGDSLNNLRSCAPALFRGLTQVIADNSSNAWLRNLRPLLCVIVAVHHETIIGRSRIIRA